MRALPALVAFALAASLVLPTAAAGPASCGCDPIILLLIVQLVVTCTAADAHYLVDGSPACWGVTPAVKTWADCRVADIEALAGQGDACA